MIKIYSKNSLDGLQIEDNIKAFLMGYLQNYLQEYEVDTIASFGEIQYLDSIQDTMTYNKIGLFAYLNEWGYEWVAKENLSDGTQIYIISVVLSTDYGLNIIATESVLDAATMTLINEYFEEENNHV